MLVENKVQEYIKGLYEDVNEYVKNSHDNISDYLYRDCVKEGADYDNKD